MNVLVKLLCLLPAVLLCSCASTKMGHKDLKSATVVQVDNGYRARDINYARPMLNATRLAVIGSQVGRGTAAHVVGAAIGAIAGGGLSYMSERKDARGAYTNVLVKLDDGSKATLGGTKIKPLPLPGDRVWVRCDSAGIPYEIVSSKPTNKTNGSSVR
jgi:outer membrane lipoprotein SlyB